MTTRWIDIAPVLHVPDVGKATDHYARRLGFEVLSTFGDPPVYVTLRRDGQEVHLQQARGSPQAPDPMRYDTYVFVSDADTLASELAGRGAHVAEGPVDRVYGLREIVVDDGFGHRLAFGSDLPAAPPAAPAAGANSAGVQVAGGVWRRTEAYAPRPTRFQRVVEAGGYRLKLYGIRYGESPIDGPAYEDGLAILLPLLPQPAVTAERPGVGFLVAHQGRGVYYLVAAWWDRENELCMRVARRPLSADGTWELTTAGESGCVWDLQVIWFEREAYVARVLAPAAGPDLDGYVASHLEE